MNCRLQGGDFMVMRQAELKLKEHDIISVYGNYLTPVFCL